MSTIKISIKLRVRTMNTFRYAKRKITVAVLT